MYFSTFSLLSIFAFSLFDTSFTYVYATPLSPETIQLAGGGLPNTTLPSVITKRGMREIQLAQFLENLEVSFFTQGFTNITSWGTLGYRNDSAKLVGKIAAVRIFHRRALRPY